MSSRDTSIETIKGREKRKLSSVLGSRNTQDRFSDAPVVISPQTTDMTYSISPSHHVSKHDYCISLHGSRTKCAFVSLYRVHDTNPGIPNKLLPLKVDC